MKRVYADTSFFLEVVRPSSTRRRQLIDDLKVAHSQIVLSEFVLVELANALSSGRDRDLCRRLIQSLRDNPMVVIVPCSQEWVQKGWRLFISRPDKGWSLTDCISFVVMRSMRLTHALTTDHHFEQCGFVALLK